MEIRIKNIFSIFFSRFILARYIKEIVIYTTHSKIHLDGKY